MTEALTVTFKPEHAERIRAAFPTSTPEELVKGIVMGRLIGSNFMGFVAHLENSPELKSIIEKALLEKESA